MIGKYRPWAWMLFAVAAGCSTSVAQNPLPDDFVAAPSDTALVRTPDWPRWRGANNDGVAQDTSWSHAWPLGKPKQLWTANVGTGFGSIAVADGAAYVMGHTDGQDAVYAFDAVTGKERWKHSYKCQLIDNLHEGGPACTPTVDGERVYTVSKEGHFFCLTTAGGKVVWEANLATDLDAKVPTWGFACSPLVLGDKVIVEAGRTAAYDKLSGKLLWKSDKFYPGYGSPTTFSRGSETLVTTLNNEQLLVLNAADGREIARHPWKTAYNTTAATPIAVAETIFISTGYNQGCALFKLAGDKLERVYEGKQMRNHFNSAVLWEGTLYGIDGQSDNPRACHLVAMDYKTGDVKWKQRGFGCGSLLIAAGKLVILSDKGELTIAKASPKEYQQLAQAPILEGKCWTTPALAQAHLYARNATGKLVALSLKE